MKAYKYLPLLLTAFLTGCYKMDVPEPEKPDIYEALRGFTNAVR